MLTRVSAYAVLMSVISFDAGAHPSTKTLEQLELSYKPEVLRALKALQMSNFKETEIRVQKISPNLFVLFGIGGNILLSTGPQGSLIVDAQLPQHAGKVLDAVKKNGGKNIDIVINTHWHFDHADGNRAFGPLGAQIIAHKNSREYNKKFQKINLVAAGVYPQPTYEDMALPSITYTDKMQVHFNGHTIDLLHFGPAHTTGDTITYFREADVIHFGDMTNLTGFPFIDSDNGGTIDGLIKSIRASLKIIGPDTIVVPGHGEVTNKARIEQFVSELQIVRDRIKAAIDQGKTLKQVLADNPANEFAKTLGDPVLLTDRAYVSLTK